MSVVIGGLKLIRVIAIVYALVLALAYFFQSRLLFYPQRLPPDFQFSFGSPFREATLALENGNRVSYLVFTPAEPRQVIVYFHGNAGDLSGWGEVAEELARRTQSEVWIVDYPGYGKSTGTLPSNEKPLIELGMKLVARARAARPGLPLVVFGRSIGSGIASEIAVRSKADRLILETPFRSLRILGKELYPFLPGWICRYDLDNERWVQAAGSMPILILHGTQDEVIPDSHSRALAQLNPRVVLASIPGGTHNTLAAHAEYWDALLGWIVNLPLDRHDFGPDETGPR